MQLCAARLLSMRGHARWIAWRVSLCSTVIVGFERDEMTPSRYLGKLKKPNVHDWMQHVVCSSDNLLISAQWSLCDSRGATFEGIICIHKRSASPCCRQERVNPKELVLCPLKNILFKRSLSSRFCSPRTQSNSNWTNCSPIGHHLINKCPFSYVILSDTDFVYISKL